VCGRCAAASRRAQSLARCRQARRSIVEHFVLLVDDFEHLEHVPNGCRTSDLAICEHPHTYNPAIAKTVLSFSFNLDTHPDAHALRLRLASATSAVGVLFYFIYFLPPQSLSVHLFCFSIDRRMMVDDGRWTIDTGTALAAAAVCAGQRARIVRARTQFRRRSGTIRLVLIRCSFLFAPLHDPCVVFFSVVCDSYRVSQCRLTVNEEVALIGGMCLFVDVD
jgi:hypothetical protein